MAITKFGDQYIVDGLEALSPFLNVAYNIRKALEGARYQFTRYFDKTLERKPMRLDAAENVAVLVVIQERPDILELITDLRSAGYYVVLFVNRLDLEISQMLFDLADAVLARRNSGRDFGAYAEFARILHRKDPPKLRRILFANDSMYYVRKRPDLFAQFAKDEAAYSGMTANDVNGDFFVNSYFFQFSRQLFFKPRLKRYFKNYVPISSARYAVAKGEIALSRLITNRMGVAPKIYFSLSSIPYLDPKASAIIVSHLNWLGVHLNQNTISGQKKKKMFTTDPVIWTLVNKTFLDYSELLAHSETFNTLDITQHLGIVLFQTTDFPYIKKNILCKGFVSVAALQQLLNGHEGFEYVFRDFIAGYAKYYSDPHWTRFLRFATLWGYL